MARKRVVMSKPTRNGCLTCRIRRIKCDEARPKCKRCTSTGRECDGYPCGLQAARNGTSARLLVPANPWEWSGPLLKGPDNFPLLARLDSSERYALQFFTLEVAAQIQVSLPAPEWVQLALQLSLSEETVLYAITAFTAMLKAHDRVLFDVSLRKFTCMDYRFSMQQYGKALSVLRKHIKDAVKLDATIEPILVSCLLFVSFEILHDDVVSARAHLQMGRAIVGEYLDHADGQTRVLPSGFKVESSLTIRQLIASFKRFRDSQVITVDPVSPVDGRSPTPAPFIIASLDEAKTLLDSLIDPGDQLRAEIIQLARRQLTTMNRGFADLDFVTQLCAAKCLSRSKTLWISDQSSKQVDELLTGHSAWIQAFYDWQSADPVKPSRQLLFLEIQHFCSHLLLSTCRTADDKSVNFTSRTFVHILDLIEQYLALAAQSPPGVVENKTQQTYSLEMGVLPALTLIAGKSDSPSIRRRAIRLFCTCDIVEGCCGSELTGRIMAAIVGIDPESLKSSSARDIKLDSSQQELHDLRRPKFLEFAATAHWADIRVVYGRFSSDNHDELELFEFEGTGYPLHIKPTIERTLPLNNYIAAL